MTRARAAEVALIGIAAVWGLTFVMVQDAIELLPTMAFLGYRFVPAALLVAVVFRRRLLALPAAGWRAGALMGVFLTAGYILQTLGLEETTASNAGFITGLFVVLTPVMGAAFLHDRIGAPAWAAAVVSSVGLYLLSGSGEPNLRGDGLVLLCAVHVSPPMHGSILTRPPLQNIDAPHRHGAEARRSRAGPGDADRGAGDHR